MKKVFLMFALLGLSVNIAGAQSKAQLRRMEQVNQIKESFDSRDFEILVDQVLYQDRAPYELGNVNDYYVKVKGDSLVCNIPYLGQMEGLNIPNEGTFFSFNGKIEIYSTGKTDTKATVGCQVKSEEGITYSFGVESEFNGLTILKIEVAGRSALFEGRLNKKKN